VRVRGGEIGSHKMGGRERVIGRGHIEGDREGE
jgi:hypothetical protein